ncbi:DUF2834 domain-containing protein [Candidatus Bathyarchaeota archaeon]|nr:DUF2834 domain-containing protein [Candidatus Bathyarchaeota archaeon]
MSHDKNIYLGLAFICFVLPYSQFIPFLMENGLDITLLLSQITSSRIAAFGWLDVAVSAIVLALMILDDRGNMRTWWLPLVATFTVGVSCGLPLYMYLKEP